MAARRLIMVLLVLLLVSSIAAALVPIERSNRDQSSTTSVALPPGPTAKLVIRRIDAREHRRPEIRMRVGDKLELTITNDRPDQVEIPALDQVEPVDLGSPARFDILVDQARVYPVRLVEADRTIARIDVTAEATQKGSADRRSNGSGRRS